MKRFLFPLLFLMSIIPDSEKHLESIHSMTQATQFSLKSIHEGLNNLESFMMQLNQAKNNPVVQPGPPSKPAETTQPGQEVKSDTAGSGQMPTVLMPE